MIGGIGLDLRDAVIKRRSVRRFISKEVDAGTIKKILSDGNHAPSAGNLQARDFIVIRGDDKKRAIAAAALNQEFISRAPVVIVVCANEARSSYKYGRRGRELYSILDASLAAQTILLSCVEEGLGSCYVGAFNEKRIKKILDLPPTIRPIGIIPIGYPDEEPDPPERIPLEKIIHWEGW